MASNDQLDEATQREACRAAVQATIDTLLDLDIRPAFIIEALAQLSVSTATRLPALRVIHCNDDVSAD